MRRGAKPRKPKVEAKPPVARKSLKNEGSRVRDLEKRLAESLEREKATSEILRVISSSPTDVQPVFDTIIASGVRLCDAHDGSVFRFDGQLIHLVAHHNLGADLLDTVRRVFPRAPGRGSVTARAILTRAVAHVPDISADPERAARRGWPLRLR